MHHVVMPGQAVNLGSLTLPLPHPPPRSTNFGVITCRKTTTKKRKKLPKNLISLARYYMATGKRLTLETSIAY